MNDTKPEQRWLCVKRVEMDSVMRNGQPRHKVWHDLIFGHMGKNRNGDDVAVGEIFHSLDGPTSEASIASFAEDYNLRRVPPSKAPTFRPASSKKVDPAQFSLPLVGSDLNLKKPTR